MALKTGNYSNMKTNTIILIAILIVIIYCIRKNKPCYLSELLNKNEQFFEPNIEYDVVPREKVEEPEFAGIITSTGSTKYM